MNRAARAVGVSVAVSRERNRLYSFLFAVPRLSSFFRTSAIRYFTSMYVAISSGFRSPRRAFGGLIAKNRHAEPANGSTYRVCLAVQKVLAWAKGDACYQPIVETERSRSPRLR